MRPEARQEALPKCAEQTVGPDLGMWGLGTNHGLYCLWSEAQSGFALSHVRVGTLRSQQVRTECAVEPPGRYSALCPESHSCNFT